MTQTATRPGDPAWNGAATDGPSKGTGARDTGARDTGSKDTVEVLMPAQSAYLAVLRTAAAGLAARLDFTLDEIEDLRIAVDEACALLLPDALPDAPLACTFELEGDTLVVRVAAHTRDGRVPARGTFAWTVLTALAGHVDARVDADRVVTIELRKRRTLVGTA